MDIASSPVGTGSLPRGNESRRGGTGSRLWGISFQAVDTVSLRADTGSLLRDIESQVVDTMSLRADTAYL